MDKLGKFFEDKNRPIVDWSKIRQYRQEETISGLAIALIESKKLLNHLLSKQGYQGRDLISKVSAGRNRFTNLSQLIKAAQVCQRVVNSYRDQPDKRELNQALAAFEKAIYDLSSQSDYSPPSYFDRLKTFFEVNLIVDPVRRRKISLYFLLAIIFILILDNSHFGQSLVSWLANLIGIFSVWILFIGLILIVAVLLFSSLISFIEERKK